MAGSLDRATSPSSKVRVGRNRGEQSVMYTIGDRPAKPLKDQWNQFTVEKVHRQEYDRPLSTVFSGSRCYMYDEDNDPTIPCLQYIDHKYLRFFYHPLEDRFLLMSGWKDPMWTNAKVMRAGLDTEVRDSRELIFGKNLIEIQQKSVPQLLVDEVSIAQTARCLLFRLTATGFPPVLRLPSR